MAHLLIDHTLYLIMSLEAKRGYIGESASSYMASHSGEIIMDSSGLILSEGIGEVTPMGNEEASSSGGRIH